MTHDHAYWRDLEATFEEVVDLGLGRGSDKYIALDWPLGEAKRVREQQCDFWEPFFLRSIADGPSPAAAR
jgi:hypothetical protein